jgi:hypothetical protein
MNVFLTLLISLVSATMITIGIEMISNFLQNEA